MEENELRIGNWVEIIQPNKEVYTTIQPSCFSVEIKKFYKPIPLTEEWLLKFGLYKLDGCFSLQTKRGNLIIEEDLCEITGNYNDIGFNAPCKYVHQLQNLYFALTGKELAKV